MGARFDRTSPPDPGARSNQRRAYRPLCKVPARNALALVREMEGTVVDHQR